METNIFLLKLLGNDNYADWSVKMKNYLLGQGLWNLVETSSKPPKPDDDVVEFEAWRKMNDMTLQAIQSSCGMDILSRINNICSAKVAWEMLAKMFMKSNGPDKLIQTENDDSIIDEGNSSSNDNAGIHISSAGATDQVRLNIQNGREKTIGSVRADHPCQLVSSLLNLLGFKRLYEMKLGRAQFQELMYCMCEAIPTLYTSPRNQYILGDIIPLAIFGAIRRGNFEFVYHIVKANPDLLMIDDVDERSIFHWAVLHRQHRIFSLIYNLKRKNGVLNTIDNSGNIILLAKNTAIDQIGGAALQMQREVQWFKEVEHICPLSHKEMLNKDGLTARQLFTKDHQGMRKEGERQMKDMATSFTVVSTLIITIMFEAAFTIPGGNDQNTGFPILMHDRLFTLFMVTDSVSLFASSTSVLMFSRIFISRYAEEDFLESLPKKIIIGLFALFISIVTMMIAFSTALLLMLHGKYWIVVPIISLAGVPIIIFVMMQFRFLIYMLGSTYGSGIFDQKMKLWL